MISETPLLRTHEGGIPQKEYLAFFHYKHADFFKK